LRRDRVFGLRERVHFARIRIKRRTARRTLFRRDFGRVGFAIDGFDFRAEKIIRIYIFLCYFCKRLHKRPLFFIFMKKQEKRKNGPARIIAQWKDSIDAENGAGYSKILAVETATEIQATVIRIAPGNSSYGILVTDGKRDENGNPTDVQDARKPLLAEAHIRPLESDFEDNGAFFFHEEQLFAVLRDRISVYPNSPVKDAAIQMLDKSLAFFLSVQDNLKGKTLSIVDLNMSDDDMKAIVHRAKHIEERDLRECLAKFAPAPEFATPFKNSVLAYTGWESRDIEALLKEPENDAERAEQEKKGKSGFIELLWKLGSDFEKSLGEKNK